MKVPHSFQLKNETHRQLKSNFSTNHKIHPKFFGVNFDFKHGYKTVNDCSFQAAAWHSCRAIICMQWKLGLRGSPPGLCLLAGLSLLLGAWGASLGKCWRSQIFLHLLWMSLDLCAALTVKRSCVIFWRSGISDKLQLTPGLVPERIFIHHISNKIKDHWKPTKP